MSHMQHEHGAAPTAANRDASGTAWQPDETPMNAVHARAGDWMLMLHGNAFVQYLHEDSERGGSQAGSINWVMAMGDRQIGQGRLQLRGMASLEPWTIAGCGYPNLLASGEVCDSAAIYDLQHPHDLVMELAAKYDRPVGSGLRLQLYGGPAGEPALGPAAFPHRASAMPNPLAPIAHHWLDATHVSYGVATAGVYAKLWKVEGSVFNGREPDQTRTDFDFGALDSWSARVWLLPTAHWALQASGGRLREAEAEPGSPDRVDVHRVTASATYHRTLMAGQFWASTIAWGRNAEPGAQATDAVLAETSLTVGNRDRFFARVEFAQKLAHDLGLPESSVEAGAEAVALNKIQGGYSRDVARVASLKVGVGGTLSAGIVPASLQAAYGGRVNMGWGVFATLRPH